MLLSLLIHHLLVRCVDDNPKAMLYNFVQEGGRAQNYTCVYACVCVCARACVCELMRQQLPRPDEIVQKYGSNGRDLSAPLPAFCHKLGLRTATKVLSARPAERNREGNPGRHSVSFFLILARKSRPLFGPFAIRDYTPPFSQPAGRPAGHSSSQSASQPLLPTSRPLNPLAHPPTYPPTHSQIQRSKQPPSVVGTHASHIGSVLAFCCGI